MAAGSHVVIPRPKFPSIELLGWKGVRGSAHQWHLIVTNFRTHMDGDAMVVGVAAER